MQLLIANSTRGGVEKGDICEIRASGTPFGGSEVDKYILVKVPDQPVSIAKNYRTKYKLEVSYEVLNRDLANDGYTIRMTGNGNISGTTGLTREKIENFLESWGATNLQFAQNQVDFDITIMAAISSSGFWDIDIAGVTFNEVSYDELTGIHRVEINHSAIGNNPGYVELWVERRGFTVISHTEAGVITGDIESSVLVDAFKDDVRRNIDEVFAKYRYYIDPANVDTIMINNGGVISVPLAVALGYINDKMND